MSYKRDGTDEREYTKATLPSPIMSGGPYGEGHRKTGSMSVEECMAKSCRNVNENGLMM